MGFGIGTVYRLLLLFTGLLAPLVLAGCAGDLSDMAEGPRTRDVTPSGFSRSHLPANVAARSAARAFSPGAQLYPGTAQFVGTTESAPFSIADDDRVHLNLANASIASATKVIVSDILGRNYIIDPRVKGTVTIQTTNAIAKSALLDTFDALLRFSNAAIVVGDDLVRIVPASSPGVLALNNPAPGHASARGIGLSAKVVPLEYVSAREMQRLLQPIIGADKILHVDERRNILIIGGNPREIATALDAINLFDIDQMKGMSFALLPVKNADPEAIVTELDTIFSTEDGGALKGVVRFVPNQRLNSILVISSRPRYLREAQKWVERLDRIAGGTKRQLFVYSIQNREASELAELLGNILTDPNAKTRTAEGNEANGGGTGSGRVNAAFQAAASARTNALTSTGGTTTSIGQSTGAGTAIGAGLTNTAAATPASFTATGLANNPAETSEGIRVVADESNNAILIYATPDEYNAILAMLKRLDSLPNQVLIEATIAEVTLSDELKFGLRWFFENGNYSLSFTDAADGAVGSTFPGLSFLFSGGQAAVALNALSSITDVNIISSPNLMVLDNRKAVLRIGDQVPIATQQAIDTTSINTVVNTIELKDTGIILTVVPRVNDSGRVILDIEQEVSDVVKTTTSGIDSPTIRQRKVNTTVVVKDGDSLALGGLIQQRAEVTKSQVPVLGDVPLVGNLFRHKDDTQKRTELLILITPHVVRDFQEANDVTDEFRRQLGGLRALGGKPGNDLQHKLNRLVR
ncbi:type II secretion system protein D (GspD) [Breoghania corrubedonensis]|uniref:Type II secretion system protein D (GspD) n=1 Tax=Breoghania corrubedonensis TaxID=665038 RepID=A0A2T5VBB8_9HYPH|nr:type II secretion system secretin GspD [Breoghania corrubedonensis]PTW61048.1 type II secretion system protein D (GspD) [Breoghania corrubedonensis]